MTEFDKDDEALRALFAAQPAPTDGPEFAARVGAEIKRQRIATRSRVQALTTALAGAGGVFAIANLDTLGATFLNATSDVAPILALLNGGAGGLILLVAVAGAAYFAAERA
jgi:hypothetical protein